VLVGEVSVPSSREHAKYVRPDELHQAFFFDLLGAPWDADAFRKVISEAMQDIAGTGSTVTWVLNNHDQVRTVTRYGEPAPEGSGLGAARARAAALLMLALPGAGGEAERRGVSGPGQRHPAAVADAGAAAGAAEDRVGEHVVGQVDDLRQAQFLALVVVR
ncbi:alpha-amylase family glycosyl hydrolase, partial [Streptomyces sp. DH12]|uniref:alpha-amylase family glycosyl hydrolase n=1 Tax=Streptomyces sp. DH12 TaxID=2857010 RepID=UPI00226C3479